MKAERRHELQTNALSDWLSRAPELFQKHGSKLLTLVILVLLVFVVIRIYRGKAAEAQNKAEVALAGAASQVQELRLNPRVGENGGKNVADGADAVEQIKSALKDLKTPRLKARAYTILGDCYWAMANFPNRPRNEAQADLKQAQEAYDKVLADFADQKDSVATARFGLAAIAENRGYDLLEEQRQSKNPVQANPYWAQAKEQYEAIKHDPGIQAVLRDEASRKLAKLLELEQPLPIEGPLPKPAATGKASSRPTTDEVEPSNTTTSAAPATTRNAVAAPAKAATKPDRKRAPATTRKR